MSDDAPPPAPAPDAAEPIPLDETALTALGTVSPRKQATILAKLAAKRAEVKNPSAYAVRSVENARREEARHVPTGTVYYVPFYADQAPNDYAEPPPGFEPHQTTTQDEWRDWDEADARAFAALDPKAAAALQALPPPTAARILLNLRRRGGVRNPSAYVMRAIMNDRAGLDPRRPSLGDIEEVPRQLADLAVADLASCLECDDVATCQRRGAVDAALRDAPARAEGCSLVFATPGSAAVHAARCAARWRGRRPRPVADAPRHVEPPAPAAGSLVCAGADCTAADQVACARRSRVAAALAAVGAQAGAKDCALVAGAAAVDPAALAEALAELPAGDRAAVAVADDELARGVALVQQVQHYFAPANFAQDAYVPVHKSNFFLSRCFHAIDATPARHWARRYLQSLLDPEGYVDLAALASFPHLSAMTAGVDELARFLTYSRLTELDSTGTKVRPRPRAAAA